MIFDKREDNFQVQSGTGSWCIVHDGIAVVKASDVLGQINGLMENDIKVLFSHKGSAVVGNDLTQSASISGNLVGNGLTQSASINGDLIGNDFTGSALVTDYTSSEWEMKDRICKHSPGLFEVERTWKNISSFKKEAVLIFEAATCYEPTYYLIPCVSYNGNKWGTGNDPKGLSHEGTPWVFAYDRCGLPSATFSENCEYSVGIFVSDKDAKSLVSSCSMISNDNRMVHKLLWPDIEEPLTYVGRDVYSTSRKDMISMMPGEEFKVCFFISVTNVAVEKTGWMKTYDKSHEIFEKYVAPIYTPKKMWELGMSYIKQVQFQQVGDYKLLRMGVLPSGKHVLGQPEMKWEYRPEYRYEIGWCGQNGTLGNALINDYLINGNKGSLDVGVKILDTWERYTRKENGLFHVIFDDIEDNIIDSAADTCNLGWGAWQMMQACKSAEKAGVLRPQWLDMGLKLCDFFLENKANDGGLGRLWRLRDGTCTDEGGTVGCFILLPMVEAYLITNDSKYLSCAENMYRFYANRDLDNMECTAGALDTRCIDKETCWPLLKVGLDLYELTGNTYYLDEAEKAGYYLLSWMFHYDVLYQENTDFIKCGFRTYGGTSVSTQHHHLDAWGALICFDWLRLAEHTGNEKWKARFYAAWTNSLLCVSDGSLVVHGMTRPAGSQNEGFLHCNWGPTSAANNKGRMNDWLQSWMGAFRLLTLMRAKDWDILK